MSNTKTVNPWDLDVRVRERNIRNGTVQEKDVEKAMTSLPDLEGQCDPVATQQPALSGGGSSAQGGES